MSDWIKTTIIPSGEGRALTLTVYCPHHKSPWTIAKFSLLENFTEGTRGWGTQMADPAHLKRTARHEAHLVRDVPVHQRPPRLRPRQTPGVTIVDGKPVQPWETEPGAEKHTTFALECRHCGRRKGGFVQRRDVNLWPVLDLLVDAGRTRVTLRELAKVIGRFDDTQRRV